jgi:mannose-6-phosphate isomerase-like protein (cupin superfamily)
MQIFRFDRGERVISRYDSAGLTATRIASGQGHVNLTCLTVEPGGTIGTHPAPGSQLFMIVTGEGWVAGPDGHQVSIGAGYGVRWDAGEVHTSGTAVGFTAIAVEGAPLALFEPEADA